MLIKDCVLLIIVGICAIQDLIQKRISIVWIFMGIIAGIGFRVFDWINGVSFSVDEYVFLIPGIVLIVISCFTSQIGMGDGLIVLMTGLFFSSSLSILMIFLAFFLLFIFSMCSYVFGKLKKNSQIPFAPFILLGIIGGLLIYA